MDVAGIGVQTITPTTGTTQTSNPPERTNDRANAQRVNPPPRPGTGNIVDKTA